MEIGLFLLLAILGTGALLLAAFDLHRKSQVKLAEIQLQRDQVALEQKQLELRGKSL